MPASETLVGRVVGDYEILREIGRGGMGAVYEAHDRTLHRRVALKILDERLARQSGMVKQFLREARAVARLSHPNIVQAYTVGHHEAIYFIAMEYLSGQTLADAIEKEGPFELDRALGIILEVVLALEQAHDKGIIHCDIKPQNVMLGDGYVKVMDFGLATTPQRAARYVPGNRATGTPVYLSPEQARGEPLDHRTDLYSLGVTLFQLLTGRPPFQADTPRSLMYQISETPLPDLRDLDPGIPRPVVRIVSKMTAKSPENRYDSAPALRSDLEAFARRGTLKTSPIERLVRPLLRGRGLWRLVVGSALVAACMALSLWVALRGGDEAASLTALPPAPQVITGDTAPKESVDAVDVDTITLEGTWIGSGTDQASWRFASFTAREFSFQGDVESWSGSYETDPDAIPAEITLNIHKVMLREDTLPLSDSGSRANGIYSLDGGTLRMAFSRLGENRSPSSFDASGTWRFSGERSINAGQ